MRYNHFKKIRNKRILFSIIKIGEYFSLSDKPFISCIKVDSLKYNILRTKEFKTFFTDDNLMVYIK